MARARGSTILSTLDFLRRECGEAEVETILSELEEEERRAVETVGATDDVPFGLALALWEAADARLGEEDAGWMERAGEHSIGSSGQELYGGILRKSDPLEFLTQPVSLFRLYYHTGDMEVVQQEPGRVVLRLVGFDAIASLFCRRQTGGLRRALELAGGSETSVRHVRCAVEGDRFCEWDLRWS